MRIYLAGPMSGIPQFNFPAFIAAADDLRDRGYDVVSPAELDDEEDRAAALASEDGDQSKLDTGSTWGDFLSRDVKLIADEGIEAIVVLLGWQESRGARMETFVGRLCGLPVVEYMSGCYMPPVEAEFGYQAHNWDFKGQREIKDPWGYSALSARTKAIQAESLKRSCETDEEARWHVERAARFIGNKILYPNGTEVRLSGERLEQAMKMKQEQDEDMGICIKELVGEVRITNQQTGGEKGQKPQRMELIPYDVLMRDVAPLYAKGAEKYADHNYRRGYAWSLSFGALMRHATQFWSGERLDEETGCPHLASVVFHALALLLFTEEHPELDDRPHVVLSR